MSQELRQKKDEGREIKIYPPEQHNQEIVNGGENFARYAVAESGAYLAYVSIYAI